MIVTKTAKLKIYNRTFTLQPTLDIYSEALECVLGVVRLEHEVIKVLTGNNKLNYIEKCIHRTIKNPEPKYHEFNDKFPKFPSYFRRACIQEALGYLSSHEERYNNWLEEKRLTQKNGKAFRKKMPTFQVTHKSFPTFYKSNMFERNEDGTAEIKVYLDNDWKWIQVKYDSRNLKNRDLKNYQELNPSLVRTWNKFFLNIPFTRNDIKLKSTSTTTQEEKVVGVDLGLTNTAVCSVMDSSGTVIDRLFIKQSREKDLMKTKLNKLAQAQRKTRWTLKPNHWRKINDLQKFISQDTANRIVWFASKHSCTHIVFENLDGMKLPKWEYGAKRLRSKLQHWTKKRIQKDTEQKAHIEWIAIRKVLARNTSKLAFDGSWEVERNPKKDVALFPNGKQYHADLNASYNIWARFFIKEYLKPLSEKRRLLVEAKVPELVNRANCSLSSLIKLVAVI